MFSGGFPGFANLGATPRSAAHADNSRLYKVLEVNKSATAAEIRDAYRRLAKIRHPDKGGSDEAFKKLHFAYEVLSNKAHRDQYDVHGEEFLDSLKRDGSRASGMAAGFDFNSTRAQPRKGKNITHVIRISLEDVLYGKQVKARVTRKRLCSTCHGSGSKPGCPRPECASCKGRGVVISVMQQGPFVTHVQQACDACKGTGEHRRPEDVCGTCSANKVVEVPKTIDVHVDKGSKHGDLICVDNEGDEEPGCENPGDVIFQLEEKGDERYSRVGCDLHVSWTITLFEALTGANVTLPYFTGETIRVHVSLEKAGIKPGDVRVIPEWGLPLKGHPGMRGDLYVRFDVQFPVVTPEMVPQIKHALLPSETRASSLRENEEVPDLDAVHALMEDERKLIKDTRDRLFKEMNDEESEANRHRHNFSSGKMPPMECTTQ